MVQVNHYPWYCNLVKKVLIQNNPVLLVIKDINVLGDQLFHTFVSSTQLLRLTPVRAEIGNI